MISCEDARHLFDAFLDGELTPSVRAEVHAHRLNCANCSHELALLEACADVIRTDRREPVLSGSFADEVMATYVDRRHVPSRRWQRIAIFTASPLAAAAVLVFAFMMLFQSTAPNSSASLAVNPNGARRIVSPAMHTGGNAVADPSHALASNTPATVVAPVIAAQQQRISNDMVPAEALQKMTPEAQQAFAKTPELPTDVALGAWIRGMTGVVDGVSKTMTQTRQGASHWADLVRYGIIPPEALDPLLFAQDRPASRGADAAPAAPAADANVDDVTEAEDETGPLWFDETTPHEEDSDQPVPTDIRKSEDDSEWM
jgi:hypothetical protein